MANFFTDNTDLVQQFAKLDLSRVVESLEGGYQNEDRQSAAPRDYDEAMEGFEAALTLLGDICANFIAPRGAAIDAKGASLRDGEVRYAAPTTEARELLAESGFMGVTLPREHGGSNMPATIYMMMIEMVSRADASLMTLFGYQDVGELIARFGTPDQAREFLPKLASGEHIGAIVLSEPGAGSDLQSVKLKAHEDEDGNWFLNGTKHFISNGCGDVLMVLARSEPKVENMFGLSLFVCGRSDKVRVTRLEEKMGLHGSPTCELSFDDAPAQLIGQRKAGLTRYVLESLNQARFSVAAQAIGIAEAAYTAALDYARQRVQFKQTIYEFPAVSEMLIDMRVALESSRALLYEGAQWLDRRHQFSHQIALQKEAGTDFEDVQKEYRAANKIVNLLSPMVKYVVTEAANKVCYDAQQIFGGMGYMRETGIERLVRDVRITTIYEGTSQIQVAASIKHVMADSLSGMFDEWAGKKHAPSLRDIRESLDELRVVFDDCVSLLSCRNDRHEIDAAARGVVDMYSRLLGGYLLLDQADADDRKRHIARRYLIDAQGEAAATLSALRRNKHSYQVQRDSICRVN
jgi:alkylation response protein AidB-like acyl-CoA dehydrogenase